MHVYTHIYVCVCVCVCIQCVYIHMYAYVCVRDIPQNFQTTRCQNQTAAKHAGAELQAANHAACKSPTFGSYKYPCNTYTGSTGLFM